MSEQCILLLVCVYTLSWILIVKTSIYVKDIGSSAMTGKYRVILVKILEFSQRVRNKDKFGPVNVVINVVNLLQSP